MSVYISTGALLLERLPVGELLYDYVFVYVCSPTQTNRKNPFLIFFPLQHEPCMCINSSILLYNNDLRFLVHALHGTTTKPGTVQLASGNYELPLFITDNYLHHT